MHYDCILEYNPRRLHINGTIKTATHPIIDMKKSEIAHAGIFPVQWLTACIACLYTYCMAGNGNGWF